MIGAICMLGGVVFGVLLSSFAEQRRGYKELVANLERERDEAKHEAKVYRNLLFPVMARVEQPQPPVTDVTQVTSERKPLTPVGPRTNRRIPFRQRWKQAAAAMNSKQKKTDALASALTNQKSQEKTNA